MEPVSDPGGLGEPGLPGKAEMISDSQSPNSPNKAGLLKTVPKERGSGTYGKRSPGFDGSVGGGAENWSSQLLLRMCSSSSLFPVPWFPASRAGR